MKKLKQNGHQSALLDWIVTQNDMHMYAMVLYLCAKFERILFSMCEIQLRMDGRTDAWNPNSKSLFGTLSGGTNNNS